MAHYQDTQSEMIETLLDHMERLIEPVMRAGMTPDVVAGVLARNLRRHLGMQDYSSDSARLDAACTIFGHSIVRTVEAQIATVNAEAQIATVNAAQVAAALATPKDGMP